MNQKMKMPFMLLALDFIGTALIGLGLAEKFADTGFIPRSMQFPNYEWIMLGIGVILTVPFIIYTVKKALSKLNI